MALTDVAIAVTDGSNTINFVVKGNAKAYEDVSGVTSSGFTAQAATSADLAKTLGVVTPIVALLESGAFKRLELHTGTKPKKSRTVVVPSKSLQVITSEVESDTGLTVDGLAMKSVSQGLRRVAR